MKDMGLAESKQCTVEPCRYGGGCWRPLCPYWHCGASRAAKWAAVWSVLAEFEAQAAPAPSKQIVDEPVPQIVGQIVVPVPQRQEEIAEAIQPIPPERTSEPIVEQIVAESPGEAGSSWPRASGTASSAVSATTTTVAQSAGETRPLELARCRGATESELAESAESSGELADETGSSWSCAGGAAGGAAAAAVGESTGEGRPPGGSHVAEEYVSLAPDLIVPASFTTWLEHTARHAGVLKRCLAEGHSAEEAREIADVLCGPRTPYREEGR